MSHIGDWHVVVASPGGMDLRGLRVGVSHETCPRSLTAGAPICSLALDFLHFRYGAPAWDVIREAGTYRARLLWDGHAGVGTVEVEPLDPGAAMAMLLEQADRGAS